MIKFFYIFLLLPTLTLAQSDYRNYRDLVNELNRLQSANSIIFSVEELSITPGGNEVYVLTLGTGDVENHPALAIVTGTEGNHLLGPELSLRFINDFMENDSLKNTLNHTTYYVFPQMSPDAMSQYFADLKYERLGNGSDTDDDRDGRLNEDPYEDLNNDGMITTLRFPKAGGKWMISEDEPRAMVKADKSKGQSGTHEVISEGYDNDEDEKFNEDGEGGVHFNKNFTYQYPWFQSGAGEHAVSEPETRALLDFLYSKKNIFAVLSFGSGNNLTKPWEHHAGNASKRVISSVQKEDAAINKRVSENYRELTGAPEKPVKISEGDFYQWAYYHFGRFSFSTPGYFIPDMKKEDEKSIDPTINTLRWLDSLNIEAFVPWTPIPDSPGLKEAQVGGLYPFVEINPPYEMIDSLSKVHNTFIHWLAAQKPRSAIEELETENLGNNLFRITLQFHNAGNLPALSKLGERVQWVLKPKIVIEVEDDQEIVSGNRVTLLDQLDTNESREMTWLIRGKGEVKIEAGAPQMGIATNLIELN